MNNYIFWSFVFAIVAICFALLVPLTMLYENWLDSHWSYYNHKSYDVFDKDYGVEEFRYNIVHKYYEKRCHLTGNWIELNYENEGSRRAREHFGTTIPDDTSSVPQHPSKSV